MSQTPTPHNGAKYGEIAPAVLMPGDPLRAKFIAETYLSEVRCFNTVRTMLGYTGTYQGTPVSVMGGGMGMPSIGIYTYELFHFYDVETVIRVGSAGGIAEEVALRDVILAAGACTDSHYGAQFHLPGTFAPIADFSLLRKAAACAEKKEIPYRVGNVLSSDLFYVEDANDLSVWQKMGVLAVEMEAAALYMNAARAGKRALCMLTVSDCPLRGEGLPAEARETGFAQMIETALDVVCERG